jgi:ADP-L-glycero-D-manno-heptose 6-epimerase
MTKNIVVTGASGFIGRNLVAALNARGYDDLILVDNLGSDEKWSNLRGLRFEDLVQPSDFLNSLELGKFSNLDAILHVGACSSTTERDADYLLQNNYAYSRRLCEWSLQHKTRFVYASSAATYGDGSNGYSDDVSLLNTLKPLNMYGYSKHMFDLWAQKNRLFDRIVGLKYFNVYGPYEDHKGDMCSVVNKAYRQIKVTGKVQLFKSYRPGYADGEQMRDFVYVKDAVAVTLHFLNDRETGGLFNCGTGVARSWKDLASATFSAMKVPSEIEFVEMPEGLRGKYQYFTQAETAKLRNAGYADSFTSLENAIQDYVATYLSKQEYGSGR